MSGTTSISSGLLSADAQIYTGRGTLQGLTVLTDGTNAATVTLYDNTAASGTVIAKLVVAGADRQGFQSWNFHPRCLNGIYADVSGTGASYIVHYGA